MKHYFTIYFFLLLASYTSAQQTKAYIGLGGMYSSFQDTRLSDIQYNEISVVPKLGFSCITEKNYWHASAYGFAFDEQFPNEDTITFSKLGYNVRFGYLRNLKPAFYLGINWDLIDYYKRQTEFLNNGADSYKLSSDFYISGKYLWDFYEDWQFGFGLDYGVFIFVNTEPSFGANYQQNIIDNGEVTFIDEDTRRPWKLNNMAFKGFWEQFNIRTSIDLNYKRRLTLSYTWELSSFSDNKGYPVTDARHQLLLIFHFINHQ